MKFFEKFENFETGNKFINNKLEKKKKISTKGQTEVKN